MTKSLMFAMLLGACSTTMSAAWPLHTSQTTPQPETATTAPAPQPQPQPRAAAPAVQRQTFSPADTASDEPDPPSKKQARLRVPAMKAEVDKLTKLISDTGIVTAGGDQKSHECNALLVAVTPVGAHGDTVVTEPPSEELTIDQLNRACEELSAAQSYAERVKPLRAAGLAGDKLDLVTMNEVDGVFGRDGVVLDAKTLSRATMAFTLHQDDEFHWTLTRYTFKGNKLISQTDEGFLTHPGPSKFR